jgi:hypothetical protein
LHRFAPLDVPSLGIRIPPLVSGVTLDTQSLFIVKPGKVGEIRTLDGMAAYACHHLAGTRIKDLFTDWVGEYTVLSMAFAADIVYGRFGHCRMVRAMRRMAVIAGVRPDVAVLRFVVTLEGLFVAFTADMPFLAFKQPPIVPGMRGMTSRAAVVFVANQMIV